MSIVEIKVPSPGESITEVEIATWLKSNGDYVELDEDICEVDSDKATLGLPSEVAGTIELLDGAYPEFIPSTEINNFTANGGIDALANTSSKITGKPGINNNKALHTIAVYPSSFTGTLKVQGTMAVDPENDDYFNITSTTFSSSSTVTTLNFTGVYHNIRFTWDKDDADTNGKIDKILYRQ